MQEQNTETAEVWRAAQHRRSNDLAERLGHFLKRSGELLRFGFSQRPLKPRFALARGVTIAVIALAAITSVSVVVDAKKPAHTLVRSTGPMPAVNVP
jgi:hypothetical protein